MTYDKNLLYSTVSFGPVKVVMTDSDGKVFIEAQRTVKNRSTPPYTIHGGYRAWVDPSAVGSPVAPRNDWKVT